ncbi:hypothetical protein ACTFIR_009299 [Dictyostelium discoideum]
MKNHSFRLYKEILKNADETTVEIIQLKAIFHSLFASYLVSLTGVDFVLQFLIKGDGINVYFEPPPSPSPSDTTTSNNGEIKLTDYGFKFLFPFKHVSTLYTECKSTYFDIFPQSVPVKNPLVKEIQFFKDESQTKIPFTTIFQRLISIVLREEYQYKKYKELEYYFEAFNSIDHHYQQLKINNENLVKSEYITRLIDSKEIIKVVNHLTFMPVDDYFFYLVPHNEKVYGIEFYKNFQDIDFFGYAINIIRLSLEILKDHSKHFKFIDAHKDMNSSIYYFVYELPPSLASNYKSTSEIQINNNNNNN